MVDCACRVSDASGSIEYSEMKTGAIRRSDLDSNVRIIYTVLIVIIRCLQCFDAVGWAAGRASGL